MGTVVKLIVGALLDWLVKQTPTIVAAWERRQARLAASAKLQADQQRIADYLKANGGTP
jgi:hypothetical protein